MTTNLTRRERKREVIDQSKTQVKDCAAQNTHEDSRIYPCIARLRARVGADHQFLNQTQNIVRSSPGLGTLPAW